MNTIDSAAEILGGEVVEEAPFNVNGDVIDLTSMDDVPDQSSKVLLPATNNVHLRIADVKVRSLSDGALKKLDIQWELVFGIEVDGEIKYQGKKFYQNGTFFDNLWFFADPAKYNSKYWTERKYLTNIKALGKAVGLTSIDPDNLDGCLKGKEVMATVAQAEIQKQDESTGDYVGTGEFDNYAKYFKPVE